MNNLRGALRCGAKTRAGRPCQCPAIRGRTRCRIHGGLSPGAPRGKGNGNFKDGFWTHKALQDRRWVKQIVEVYTKGIVESSPGNDTGDLRPQAVDAPNSRKDASKQEVENWITEAEEQ